MIGIVLFLFFCLVKRKIATTTIIGSERWGNVVGPGLPLIGNARADVRAVVLGKRRGLGRLWRMS